MSYGGSSGGGSRIATAADAALSNPLTGDALVYNATLQKWVNGGVSKIGTIAVSGAPAAGQVLTATGSTAATWATSSGGSANTVIDCGYPDSSYGGSASINGGTP